MLLVAFLAPWTSAFRDRMLAETVHAQIIRLHDVESLFEYLNVESD